MHFQGNPARVPAAITSKDLKANLRSSTIYELTYMHELCRHLHHTVLFRVGAVDRVNRCAIDGKDMRVITNQTTCQASIRCDTRKQDYQVLTSL